MNFKAHTLNDQNFRIQAVKCLVKCKTVRIETKHHNPQQITRANAGNTLYCVRSIQGLNTRSSDHNNGKSHAKPAANIAIKASDPFQSGGLWKINLIIGSANIRK